jgi:ATP-dependent Lon protease
MADTNTADSVPHGESSLLPGEVVPLIAMRNVALLPGTVVPITLGREESLAAAQEAVRSGKKIGLLLQHDAAVEKPTSHDLNQVGVLATVVRYVTAPDGTHHLVAQGEGRFRVKEFAHERPYFAAHVEALAETNTTGPQIEARAEVLKARAIEALSLLPQVPAELARTIQSMDSPSRLADLIISFMDVKPQEKQGMIETLDLQERLDKVLKLLANRLEVLKITRDITEQTQTALGERQREAVLREQMRQLQKELGDDESSDVEIKELEEAIEKA